MYRSKRRRDPVVIYLGLLKHSQSPLQTGLMQAGPRSLPRQAIVELGYGDCNY